MATLDEEYRTMRRAYRFIASLEKRKDTSDLARAECKAILRKMPDENRIGEIIDGYAEYLRKAV